MSVLERTVLINNIRWYTRLIDGKWYKINNITTQVTVLANDRTALLMEITNV